MEDWVLVLYFSRLFFFCWGGGAPNVSPHMYVFSAYFRSCRVLDIWEVLVSNCLQFRQGMCAVEIALIQTGPKKG